MIADKVRDEEGLELLKRVEALALEGKNQRQISEELGFKTTLTLNSRLVKASQNTGKPVPPFKPLSVGGLRQVDEVVVRRRGGRGNAYGVNVPQEPLRRARIEPGEHLSLTVNKKQRTILLRPAADIPPLVEDE